MLFDNLVCWRRRVGGSPVVANVTGPPKKTPGAAAEPRRGSLILSFHTQGNPLSLYGSWVVWATSK